MNTLLCALLTTAVAAEPEPKPGDLMIEKYLKRLTEEQSKKFLDGDGSRAFQRPEIPRKALRCRVATPERSCLRAVSGVATRHEAIRRQISRP